MLLAIDVGNTQTVIGVYDEGEWTHVWRTHTTSTITYDELHVKLQGLFEAAGIAQASVDGVALSSVVPFLTDTWKITVRHMFSLKVCEATRKNADGLVNFSAYPSRDLGEDRIADCVAARRLYGAPVIVVDFGTATNMEAIDAIGHFRGGIIAPGVKTSMDALVSRAALLPEVGLQRPPVALGLSTQTAMQVGIVYGEADRVDGLVRRVWEQLGYKSTRVIATGGLGNAIGPLCQTVTDVDNKLTLQGLRFIYEHRLYEMSHGRAGAGKGASRKAGDGDEPASTAGAATPGAAAAAEDGRAASAGVAEEAQQE